MLQLVNDNYLVQARIKSYTEWPLSEGPGVYLR